MDNTTDVSILFHPPEDYLYKPTTANIQSAIITTNRYLIFPDRIVCAVSGGWDSDIMLDMVHKIDRHNKIKYVFYDTGLEMQATKEHIAYLEKRYGINISRIRPKKTIPAACRQYGQPFLSKKVAEYIERLQRHSFQWEIEPFDTLYERYPKCKAALRWWCNDFGEKSRFNINQTAYLCEFMHDNPPDFLISPKCCNYGKKEPAHTFAKENDIQLTLLGIRKAEGGARQTAYKTCFHSGRYGEQHFPLFWFTDEDKQRYDEVYEIDHSRAYTEYGCERTGCAACPFGSRFEQELSMLKRFEPNLYKAAMNIFGDSIEYTRKYRLYKERRKEEKKKSKANSGDAPELEGQIEFTA